ncbi:neuroparsin-A-like [Venturia canescens]|uniref:neuroparsin-A-like n=1 Tax=Venturia canescens TaxID=32260 RepID=UPI001C9C41E6|nr:neuroparsin-A-like [Venturia canescens]
MLAFQSFTLTVLLVAILPICLSHPSIRTRESERRECQGCGRDCNKCVYGVAISPLCGVLECRKGPNERCGGHNNVKGVCGEGMLCQCEKCTGCSIDTLKCSDQSLDEPCRPSDSNMSGYWDPLRNNWFTLVK